MAYRLWLFFALGFCCAQIDHAVASKTRSPWYCYGDICNIDDVDQYCSKTYLKCIDCYEIRHDCFTEEMPLNCTIACKEYTLEQLNIAEMTCIDPPNVRNGKWLTDPKSDFTSYDTRILQCENGFTLEGSSVWKCQNGTWVSTSLPNDYFPVCAKTVSIVVYVLIALLIIVVSSGSSVVIMMCCTKCQKDNPHEVDPEESTTEVENKAEEEQPAIRLNEIKKYTQPPVPNLNCYRQNEVEKETSPLLTGTDDNRRQSNSFDGSTESRRNTNGRNPNTGDSPVNGLVQVNLNIKNQNQMSVINAQNSSTNIAPNAATPSDNRDPPNNDEINESNNTAQQTQESSKYPTMETQPNETEPKNIYAEGRGATGGAQLGFVQQESNEQDLNRKVTVGQAEIQIGDHIGANNAPNGKIPPDEIVPS